MPMKKVLFTLAIFSIFQFSKAQTIHQIAREGAEGWFKIHSDVNISAEQFLANAPQILGLGQDELRVQKIENDQLGFTHYRLLQHHKGIPVEMADFLLHENNNRLLSLNGELVYNLNLNTSPALSSQEAISKAIDFVGAQRYMWEDEHNEVVLQDLYHDAHASYYPEPVLVFAQKDFNKKASDYRLMYRMDIYAVEPLSRQDIYVDALTGEILFTHDKIHTGDVPGIAHTKYSGQQTIITDSVAPNVYRLRETTTGGGNETYNMQGSRDYTLAVDFIDSNNVWDNVNAAQDEVATDAHWGAQTTYEYFLNEHNRDSYDNKGTKLLSYVHYDVNYVNAFWDGQRMTYGDGNGSSFSALISLDIAAHELTHGVTQNTAGLVYRNEWGALNESFSDIFAATTELYGTPNDANYDVGELVTSNGLGLRSMSNPKSMGDPDTYLAGLWYTGPLDNGGVHINSGVQNYWFYVLAEGDSAQNDLGNVYDLDGIGMSKAGKIAYRNLAYYLTRTSEYFDARAGSIQAAEDLYGVCSTELIAVADAWRAVGVGDHLQDKDMILVDILHPNTSCGLGIEAPTLLIRYYDCNDTVFSGDSIQVGLFVDNISVSNEWYVIGNQMLAGDTLLLTLNDVVDFSAYKTYNLKAWINYFGDQDPSNDTIFNFEVSNSPQQNGDFAIVDMLSPISGCELSDKEEVKLSFMFQGCDSLVGGQPITIGYSVNGVSATQTNILPVTLYPGDITSINFPANLDLSAKGVYDFDFWVNYSGDPESSNDTLYNRALQNPHPVGEHLYTFENESYTMDSLYFVMTADSKADLTSKAAETDSLGLRLTGSNPFSRVEDFLMFNRRNPWSIHPSFSSMACACVDARDWDSVKVSFDLKQTYSISWVQVLGYPEKGVSSFRVTVDGQQIGETFQPITNKNDRFRLREFNLSQDYHHSQFELCLEARNYLAEEFDPSNNSEGDNAYIDNFRIYNDGNVSLAENEKQNLQLNIFPNPTDAKVNMSFDLNEPKATRLEVMNSNGQLIKTLELNLKQGINEFELDLSDYPKGLYIFKVENFIEKVILR